MRRCNLFLILILIPVISYSQNWLPLDKGIGKTWADVRQLFPDSNGLFVTGSFTEDGNGIPMRGIAKWNDTKWDSVGDANMYNSTKSDMCRYNDILIVSGYFQTPFRENLVRLVGEIWDTIPNSIDLNVSCFLEKDGVLYMGGGFDKCGNDSTFGLGRFDGVNFSGMTPCYEPLSSQILCLSFFQDTLYVGGVFYLYPQLQIAGLAKWDGANLIPVSSEFLNATCAVFSMAVYNNELYIGGGFQKTDGFTGDNIMKWDGHNFSEVGGGANNAITSLKVYNGELYVGGKFTQIGGNNCQNIAKWNGSQWTCLNHDPFDNFVNVRDICIYKDELYVAGIFRKIGDDSLSSIAKYNHPLISIKENPDADNSISVYPNPFDLTTTLHFSVEVENVTLQIFDIPGKEVKRIEAISGNQIVIFRDGLRNGMYFFRVLDGNVSIGQGKLVVE